MLELYHGVDSVCAQKVRIALKEKGQEAKDHIMTLRGDQYEPAYLKLNPNGVVPTLIHDGEPITKSSLILYYIDDAFPEPPLMPTQPRQRHRVGMYNKLIDEYVHNSCTILTFATAFRPAFLKMTPEAWQAEINKTPLRRRAEYKRSVIEHRLDSEFVADALARISRNSRRSPIRGRAGLRLAGEVFPMRAAGSMSACLPTELLSSAAGRTATRPSPDGEPRGSRGRRQAAIFDRVEPTECRPLEKSKPDSSAEGPGIAEAA